jgi:hypothetical protein
MAGIPERGQVPSCSHLLLQAEPHPTGERVHNRNINKIATPRNMCFRNKKFIFVETNCYHIFQKYCCLLCSQKLDQDYKGIFSNHDTYTGTYLREWTSGFLLYLSCKYCTMSRSKVRSSGSKIPDGVYCYSYRYVYFPLLQICNLRVLHLDMYVLFFLQTTGLISV